MGSNSQIDSHVIFFDGVCNLCNTAINQIIDADADEVFKFSSLQSDFASGFLKSKYPTYKQVDSIILYQNGHFLIKSSAAMAIAKSLSWPWRFFSLFRWLPVSFTDLIYDWIAKNRYDWFGKRSECRLPTANLKSRFLDS